MTMAGLDDARLRLRLTGASSEAMRELLDAADALPDLGQDIAVTLDWAGRFAPALAVVDSVSDVWEALASVAYRDVAAARILEPHLDALRIIAEARDTGHDLGLDDVHATNASTWGVFAAEGAGVRLDARETDGRWMLHGTKPWCSLAAHLSHALVTAWVDDTRRGLFAVELTADGVHPHYGPWHSRGLPGIVSAAVDFDGVVAVPVGDPGWYLRRPGFAVGGMGVAACWWGGALALLRPLGAAAAAERADQMALVHLGRADVALWAARTALTDAATRIDTGEIASAPLVAARVRAIVADAAEKALNESEHALGPLPLVADEEHARRTADLRIYLRQHHGDRDLARLGRDLTSRTEDG